MHSLPSAPIAPAPIMKYLWAIAMIGCLVAPALLRTQTTADSAPDPHNASSELAAAPSSVLGNFIGSATRGSAFAAGAIEPGAGKQPSRSFVLLSPAEPPLLNAPHRFTSGTVLLTAPTTWYPTSSSLNQLMRGKNTLRAATIRSTYRDALRADENLNQSSPFVPSAIFTTSDLGNGVFLSAGANTGGRSNVGAPAASLGNGAAGARHSGPSLGIKLSF
jgi:hypothetical protein